MHAAVLLLATLAASASANIGIARFRRDMMASATPSATPTACLTDAMSLVESIPTPPPQLESYFAANPPTGNVCTYTVPQSLSSVLLSYDSEVKTWYSSHEAEFKSLESECSGLFTGVSDSLTCTTGPAGGATAGGSGSTPATQSAASPTQGMSDATLSPTTMATGSAASSASSAAAATTATGTKNAGPRETGLAAAAMAIAGVLGGIIAL